MKFEELGLGQEVLAGVEKAGYTDLTEVQEKVLPVSLTGRDVMVRSKTGSGKTAVFLLTILEKFLKDKSSAALVVSPTRELAVQIEEDAKLLSSGLEDFRIGCFYGGVGYQNQLAELKSGLALYVGTPGRLLDFSKSSKIDFRCFNTVVLDEADRMFDMGFYPDIQKMFSRMVAPDKRQTMLFSATLSTKVRNLAWQYMNMPEEMLVQPEEITVKSITQELFHVSKEEKFGLLLSILKKEQPESCLIFANTKDKTVEVAKRLVMNGYKAEYLMGDMPQSQRLKTLDKMKEGQLPYLVATDVAARGLQIDDLALVVNYDIPEDFESYVHRIGRTARAGKSGKAITLASEDYIYGLEAIENYIQMKIPVLWADEIGLESVEDKSEGYHYRSPRRPSNDGRRGDRRQGSAKPSSKPSSKPQQRSGKPKAQGVSKTQGEGKAKKPDSKQYEELSAMTLEERMAYYKKEYGQNAKASSAKPRSQAPKAQKPQDGQKPKQPKPQQQAKKAPEAKLAKAQETKAEPEPAPVQAPEVKKGFFARMLGKIKGER